MEIKIKSGSSDNQDIDVNQIANEIIAQADGLSPSIMAYLIESEKTPHGLIKLRGQRAFDMGMILLLIEELGAHASRVRIADIAGVTQLTVRDWVRRLNEEAMGTARYESISHITVSDWGIYNKALYEPLRSYVKFVLNNWAKANKYELDLPPKRRGASQSQ